MDLSTLMDEIAAAAGRVKGIKRSYAYPPEKVEPPAALLAWPTLVTYDQTYAGGMDQYEIPLYVVIGRAATIRTKRDQIADWLEADVKNEVESATYTGSPVVKVVTAETDSVELAGISYLATLYTIEVSGTGSR